MLQDQNIHDTDRWKRSVIAAWKRCPIQNLALIRTMDITGKFYTKSGLFLCEVGIVHDSCCD